MQVRLAFSVMIQVDADILLIDEVLAVGDAVVPAEVLRGLPADEGRGPHDPLRHARHGRRRALLRSRDAARARPRRADRRAAARSAPATSSATSRSERAAQPTTATRTASGDRRAEIVDAWFEEDGQRTDVLHQGTPCSFAMRVRFHEPLRDPIIAFLIENDRHHPLFAISNEDGGVATGEHEAGDEATFSGVVRQRARARAASSSRRGCSQDGGAPIVDRRGALRHGDGHGHARLRRAGRPAGDDALRARRAGVGVSVHARSRAHRRSAGAAGASRTWRPRSR